MGCHNKSYSYALDIFFLPVDDRNPYSMSLDGVEASSMGSVDPSVYSNIDVLPVENFKTAPSMFFKNYVD